MTDRLQLVVVADVPAAGVAAFRAYEHAVLPLLERHGGRLERRLRTADGRTELHIVSFGSRDGFAAFQADPDRLAHGALLAGVSVTQRVLEVSEVAHGAL